MKTKMLFIAILINVIANSNLNGQSYPRLFFNSSEFNLIRYKATTPGTKAYEMWMEIKEHQADFLINNPAYHSDFVNDGNNYEALYACALAHKMYNNPAYLITIRKLVFGNSSFTGIINVPVDNVDWLGAPRILILSLLYDLLYSDLSEIERSSMKTKIVSDISNIRHVFEENWNKKHQGNHYAVWMSSIGIAAIVLNGDPAYADASNDYQLAKDRLISGTDSYLNRMFSDGAGHEGVNYGFWGMNSVFKLMEAIKKKEGTDYFTADINIKNRLNNISKWLAYEYSSGNFNFTGIFNLINDNIHFVDDDKPILNNLLILAAKYNDGVAQWVFNKAVGPISNTIPEDLRKFRYAHTSNLFLTVMNYNDVSPINPGTLFPKSILFKERGLAYIKTPTDWSSTQGIQFAIEGHQMVNPSTGIYTKVHSQSDKNHFILNAFGQSFFTDPGYGVEAPEAHNYILINNVGQARNPYWETSKEYFGLVGSSNLTMSTSSCLSLIHGDAKKAFNNLHDEVHTSPSGYVLRGITDYPFSGFVNPVLNADRYVVFKYAENGIPDYLIIADDINKNGASYQNYDWLCHSITPLEGYNPYTLGNVTDAHVKMWVTSAYTVSVSSTPKQYAIAPSIPESMTEMTQTNMIHENKIRVNAINPYYHILLYPNYPTMPQPNVSYPSTTGGSAIKIMWQGYGYTDISLFKYSTDNIISESFQSNAKVSQIRISSSNSIVSIGLEKGSLLYFNNSVYVNTYGVIANVISSNGNVVIDGSGIDNYKVYAPNASSVLINGIPSPFIRNGDYVEKSNSNIVPPSNLHHLGIVGSVMLSWDNANSNIQYYEIWREWSFGWTMIATSDVANYEDTEFSYEVRHHEDYVNYKVRSITSGGQASEFSNTINVGGIDNGMFHKSSTEVAEVLSDNLLQNSPNPFNPSTKINYALSTPGFVTLKIYDMLGKEVATLVNNHQESGRYSVNFDGSKLSSGMYMYKLTSGSFSEVKKMMLVK